MKDINYKSKGTGGKYNKNRKYRTISYAKIFKKQSYKFKFQKSVKMVTRLFRKKSFRRKLLQKKTSKIQCKDNKEGLEINSPV